MAKIRSLALFDRAKFKKMVSFLGVNQASYYTSDLLRFPLNFFHSLLPLKLKTAAEAYVAMENKKLCGMVALRPNRGNTCKWKINKLVLAENSFYAGRQLIDYAVSYYGALGVNTFIVNVESSQQEVLELFSQGCGFKFCSFEQTWKMNTILLKKPKMPHLCVRPFKKADAQTVCELYNDSIYSNFRYSLCKSKSEFYDEIFSGLSKISSFKYVFEDVLNRKIRGYVVIKTEDNYNFLLEMTLSAFCEENFEDILNCAITQIMRRKNNFRLFIVNKKYKQNSVNLEKHLKGNDFTLVQSQSVLVKDYFKRINEEDRFTKPAILFNDIKGKPAFNQSLEVR